MSERPERGKRLPLALYALGTFAIGTTELVVVGLLPEVARDLGVGVPAAGMLVTGFALGVVFGGPVLTIATVGMPRKPLLLALMGIFVGGNVLAAVAPDYAVLMAGRIVSAFAMGAFFGVANVVAAKLVGEERRGPRSGFSLRDSPCQPWSGFPSEPSSASNSAGDGRSGSSPFSEPSPFLASRASSRESGAGRLRNSAPR